MHPVKWVFVAQLSIQRLFEAGWFHWLLWQLWGKKSVIVFLDSQQTEARLPQSVCPLPGGHSAGLSWTWCLLSFIKWLQWFDILPRLPPCLYCGCLPYRAQFLLGAQFPVHTLSTFVVLKQETSSGCMILIRDRGGKKCERNELNRPILQMKQNIPDNIWFWLCGLRLKYSLYPFCELMRKRRRFTCRHACSAVVLLLH